MDRLLIVTYYPSIRNAVFNYHSQEDVMLLVHQLTAYRRLYLTVHSSQAGGSTLAALLSAVSVFITANICWIYDDVDETMFRSQVEAIGPAAYTFINALPGILTQACCIATIIALTTSWLTIFLFCIAAYTPIVMQIIANGMMAFQPPDAPTGNGDGITATA
ncbi:hypothetical protein BDQ17DRAFT_1330198 [Cyathus striatus]|nr:hypothetical protein BDQ17DRAFT_1330198 [Cyathus striatus]